MKAWDLHEVRVAVVFREVGKPAGLLLLTIIVKLRKKLLLHFQPIDYLVHTEDVPCVVLRHLALGFV